MTKPNKDGWVRHRGGKCPVDRETQVHCRLRSGETFAGAAKYPHWEHLLGPADVMAYKVMASHVEPIKEGIDEMQAAKYFDGPLQWRDRIREIDAASKEEEARNCDAMAAYDSERASLVAKLKAEGFVLVQSDEPNSEDESAQQDMSDWRNWQKGDVVECVSHNNEWSRKFKIGERGIVEDLNTDATKLFVNIDGWNVTPSDFKWHSRPTN